MMMATATGQVIRLHRPARRVDEGSGVSSPPPLGLYVHLPWCVRKCPYCDFNSHESRDWEQSLPEEDYLRALERDLDWSLPLVWGRTVQSVFIGGGTPSLFSARGIDRMLASVRARMRLAADVEITMEANPGTFERERFAGYGAAGVNRLSLGVQTFSDRALAAIGRIHGGGEAIDALEQAMTLFPRVNVDLMYGLPGQSLGELAEDLDRLERQGVSHWSVYHLTLEEGTPFARRPPVLPEEALEEAMQALIESRGAAAGLERYEVSAWARPGAQCRHNLNYWKFGDYLGIGAGAHGKISFHDRIIRQARHRNPRRYMAALLSSGEDGLASPSLADLAEPLPGAPWIETVQRVSAADLPFEFMLNALRLREGVPASLFAERTGLSLASLGEVITRAVERGLLDADPGRLRATDLGWRHLNELQSLFLTE
jgi:putative oxygen-independent coproporphyrinogen III oxidase